MRQSGAIEQDADVVMFLHRDPQDRTKPETELLIAKHRHGIEGMIQLDWIGSETRYADRTDRLRTTAFDTFNAGAMQ